MSENVRFENYVSPLQSDTSLIKMLHKWLESVTCLLVFHLTCMCSDMHVSVFKSKIGISFQIRIGRSAKPEAIETDVFSCDVM